MKTYLCGPINGRSDADCKDWRARATEVLGADNVLDPMRRDFRGKEAVNAAEIVEGDKADIASVDTLLVYFDKPSVGTSMEVVLAWQMRKHVVVVNASDKPLGPWLLYHAHAFYHSLEAALAYIEAMTALSKRSA
jgi:hypothetical protein